MTLNLELRHLVLFVFAFIFFTAIGTFTHELGHGLIASFLGYDFTICHDRVLINSDNISGFDSTLIFIGGPLQTVITGLLGLFILWLRRTHRLKNGLIILDWVAIFLGLFWLREVFNIMASIVVEIVYPNGTFFTGDEAYISEDLGLPIGFLPFFLGFIGLLISTYLIFKVIPPNLRLTFILSGIIGGFIGLEIWMNRLGPLISGVNCT